MYVDIRVFDFVLLGLVIYMIGALLAHLGEPQTAGHRSKWVCIIGATIVVVAGIARLFGLGL